MISKDRCDRIIDKVAPNDRSRTLWYGVTRALTGIVIDDMMILNSYDNDLLILLFHYWAVLELSLGR
jgi:hypothetical protein